MNPLEADGAVEDAAGFDRALKHVGLGDVGAGGAGPPATLTMVN